MLVNQVSRVISITCIRILLNTGRRFVYPFAPALGRSLRVSIYDALRFGSAGIWYAALRACAKLLARFCRAGDCQFRQDPF